MNVRIQIDDNLLRNRDKTSLSIQCVDIENDLAKNVNIQIDSDGKVDVFSGQTNE